jgi:hypothetical protein
MADDFVDPDRTVFVFKGGQKQAFTEAELLDQLKAGFISEDDLIFTTGLADWTPLGNVFNKESQDYCPANPGPVDSPSSLHLLPSFFFAAVALTYATGFLTVFCYFDSIGLKGTSIDSFKAKYIYVGLLALELPLGAIALVLAYRFMWAQRLRLLKKEDSFYVSAPALLGLMAVVFYLLIAFARPGVFYAREWQIFFFFSDIIISVVGLRVFEEMGQNTDRWPRCSQRLRKRFAKITTARWERLRLYGLLIAAVLALSIFWDHIPLFFEMTVRGGYLYIGFVIMMSVLLWRVVRRLDGKSPTTLRNAVGFVTAPVIFILFYLSVVLFGTRIYPYIPSRKGGGDFTTENGVTLYFAKEVESSLPSEIRKDSSRSTPVIIIEETAEAIFVTPFQAGSAKNWRRPEPNQKPEIFRIPLSEISAIDYSNKPQTKEGLFW